MGLDRKTVFCGAAVYCAVLLACLAPGLTPRSPTSIDWPNVNAMHELVETRGWEGRWRLSAENSTALAHSEGKVFVYFTGFSSTDTQTPRVSLLTLWVRDGEFADERVLRIRTLTAFDPGTRAFTFPSEGGRVEDVIEYDHAQPLRQLNCSLSGRVGFTTETAELSTAAALGTEGMRLNLQGSGECTLKLNASLAAASPFPPKGIAYGLFVATIVLINWFGAAGILRRAADDTAQLERVSLTTTLFVCLQDSFALMLHLSFALDFGGEPLFFALFLLFFSLFSLMDFHVLAAVWRWQRAREFAALSQPQVQRRTCLFQLKFYLAVVSYNYVMWRLFLASAVMVAQGLVLLPQALRLATRAVSPRFDADFLLFFAAAKYLLFQYWRGCPGSFTTFRLFPTATLIGLALLMSSVGLLLLQSKRGPRFFLPPAWRSTFPYFLSRERYARQETSSEDCLICLSALKGEAPPWSSTNSELSPLAACAAQRHCNDIMLAPCSHAFHPGCLLQWMERKMECPACRASLPPIY